MKIPRFIVLACLCALPLAASAQWQWIDANGKKVFSDQPPPMSVPERNIVRRPGPPSASVTSPSQAVAAPAPAASVSTGAPRAGASPASPKPSGVDKDLEDKARRAEDADKARQAAEAEKAARAKADNCARARQGKATFDSGIRVARINANGEREIMDDGAREAENRRLQSIIDSDCS